MPSKTTSKKETPKAVEAHSEQVIDQMNATPEQANEANELNELLILAVKVSPSRAFFYKGEQSLPNLCKILGYTPKIDFAPDGSLTYSFGKRYPDIYKPCIIFLDGFNQIILIRQDVKDVFNSYNLVSSKAVEASDFAKPKKA